VRTESEDIMSDVNEHSAATDGYRDFDIAMQRLTTWVRDYGDTKPREFIGDITIVLMVARDVDRQRQTIEKLLLAINDVGEGLFGTPETSSGKTWKDAKAEWWQSLLAAVSEAEFVVGVSR